MQKWLTETPSTRRLDFSKCKDHKVYSIGSAAKLTRLDQLPQILAALSWTNHLPSLSLISPIYKMERSFSWGFCEGGIKWYGPAGVKHMPDTYNVLLEVSCNKPSTLPHHRQPPCWTAPSLPSPRSPSAAGGSLRPCVTSGSVWTQLLEIPGCKYYGCHQ